MPTKPSPRIAIKPELYEAIRLRAAKEGMWPHELVSMWIRERLEMQPSRQTTIEPDDHATDKPHEHVAKKLDSQMHTKPDKPQHSETPKPSQSSPPEEKKPSPSRPWHGGPPPYEEQHPEIAARVLAMWAGGSKNGGMSREAVAKALRAEGIPMTAGTVSKITIRSRQKNK
jgi:hypothetical protein